MKKKIKTDPAFSGHLERPLISMSPREKLLYLSRQISLRSALRQKVVRKIGKPNRQGGSSL